MAKDEAKKKKRFQAKPFFDISPDIAIKNMVMFVVFVSIASGIINYYTWPAVLKLKESVTKKQEANFMLEAIDKKLKRVKDNTLALKDANILALKRLSHDADAAKLKEQYGSYFIKLDIKKINEENLPNKEISIIRYKFSGVVKDAFTLSKFITDINSSDEALTISLPILMQKNKADQSLLDFTLYIDVNVSTYKPVDLDAGY